MATSSYTAAINEFPPRTRTLPNVGVLRDFVGAEVIGALVIRDRGREAAVRGAAAER